MREGQASSTAQYIALVRSWLTRAGILDDPYAQGFLDRRRAALERAAWLARSSRIGHGIFAHLAARTRFYDSLVTESLDTGITQVVIVAAGYDSRAWRLGRPGVRFFEVDHPDTQARKRALAPENGPTFVAADLGSIPLNKALLDSDFDPEAPAVFCCEGLTMYLAEADVRTLLTAAADVAAAGSRLGVDFAISAEARTMQLHALRLLLRVFTSSHGERVHFTIDPAHTPPFLAKHGWSTDTILAGSRFHERYLEPDELPRRWRSGPSFVVAATIA